MALSRYLVGLSAAMLLAACSDGGDDHGHPHSGEAEHQHEAAASEEDHGHAHDDSSDAHDAPETEVFFGEQSSTAAETDMHAHEDGEHHMHDEIEQDADNARRIEQNHSHDGEAAHKHDH